MANSPDRETARPRTTFRGVEPFILADPWGAQLSDDDINLRINNNGYPIDLDAIWVSSGI